MIICKKDLEKFYVKDMDAGCKAQIISEADVKKIVRDCDFVIFM